MRPCGWSEKMRLLLLAALAIAVAFGAVNVFPYPGAKEARAAATIIVTGTADGTLAVLAGNATCDLREGIQAANTNLAVGGANGCIAGTAGLDNIHFNIPGAGVKTISPTSALPTITDPVFIDGYTQPGASANTLAVGNNAVLLIELNGTGAGINGLTITAGNSTERGLVINRFSFGIVISSGNNVFAGNFIGTNPTGSIGLSNSVGVHVPTGANNLIGGTTPQARNVISGSVSVLGNIFIAPKAFSTRTRCHRERSFAVVTSARTLPAWLPSMREHSKADMA
jgi:hypothetical protein